MIMHVQEQWQESLGMEKNESKPSSPFAVVVAFIIIIAMIAHP